MYCNEPLLHINSFRQKEGSSSIDKQDINGDTPLHIASEKGNAETVDKLLHKGAESDKENYKHGTLILPIHLASIKGHTRYILQYYYYNN